MKQCDDVCIMQADAAQLHASQYQCMLVCHAA